jgi:hypothetical protein
VEVGFLGARRVVQSAEGALDGLDQGHEQESTRAAAMLRGSGRFFSAPGRGPGEDASVAFGADVAKFGAARNGIGPQRSCWNHGIRAQRSPGNHGIGVHACT